MVLNVILMNIGKRVYGIAGIVLVSLIPIWYILVSFAEKTGDLSLAERRVAVEADRAQRERGRESGEHLSKA